MARRAAATTSAAADAAAPTLLYLVGRLDRVVRRAIQEAVHEQGLSVNEFTTPSGVIVKEYKIGQGAPTLPRAVVTVHMIMHLKDGWKKIEDKD